jgi:MFS family permease
MGSRKLQQSPGTKPRLFYGYIVVVAAFFIVLASMGSYLAFGVFFTPLLTEFGWTRAMTSVAFSLSWIMQGSLGIVMGGLTDRFGPRIVLTLCGFFLGLGYLLISQVSAIWHIYLFYGVIIGIGMSGTMVPLASTVARWFTKRRSIANGIVLCGVSVGILIVPPVASRLIATYDWRVSYIILAGLVFVVIILAAQFLKRDPAGMGQVPYGENDGEGPPLELQTEGYSLREAVVTRQFWLLLVMFGCMGFCRHSIIVHIVPHATELGMSATSAANLMAVIGGLSTAGRLVLGTAADRGGNKQVFIVSFALVLAALLWLVPAGEAWMLYLFAAVFGLSMGGAAAESPLVAGLFGLSSHGLIFGILGVGITLGAALGPYVAGYIFDVAGSYQAAFLVSASAGVIGLISTIFLTPTKRRRVHL